MHPLGAVLARLAATILTGRKGVAITDAGGRPNGVSVMTVDGTCEWLPADAVIFAVPLPAAAGLLEGRPDGRPIAASLRRVATASVQALRFVFEPGPPAPVRHGAALTPEAGFVFLCLDTFMPAYQGTGERFIEIQATPEVAGGADVEAPVRGLLPDGRAARLREIMTPVAVRTPACGVGGRTGRSAPASRTSGRANGSDTGADRAGSDTRSAAARVGDARCRGELSPYFGAQWVSCVRVTPRRCCIAPASGSISTPSFDDGAND